MPAFRMFVGSAAESSAVAKALVSHFQDELCEADLWEFAFTPGRTTLHELQRAVREHQFAAFVFTPDDTTLSRGTETGSPRDNVILEMGLFCNAYGTERCFAVLPENEKVKIPSDLLGIGFATYRTPESPRQSHNQWKNRLLDAAEQIRSVMSEARDADRGGLKPEGGIDGGFVTTGLSPLEKSPDELLVLQTQVQAQQGLRSPVTSVFAGKLVVHALYGVGQVVLVGPTGGAAVEASARVRFSPAVGIGDVRVSELFDVL